MELRAQRALSPVSTTRARRPLQKPALALLTACLMALPAFAQVSTSGQGSTESGSEVSGPIRLNSTTRAAQDTGTGSQQSQQNQPAAMSLSRAPKYVPGEFEIYVNKLLGIDLTDPSTLEQLRRADTGLAEIGTVSQTQTSAAGKNATISADNIVRRLGADLMLDTRMGARRTARARPRRIT